MKVLYEIKSTLNFFGSLTCFLSLSFSSPILASSSLSLECFLISSATLGATESCAAEAEVAAPAEFSRARTRSSCSRFSL